MQGLSRFRASFLPKFSTFSRISGYNFDSKKMKFAGILIFMTEKQMTFFFFFFGQPRDLGESNMKNVRTDFRTKSAKK